MIIKKNKSNLFNPVSLVFVLLMTDTCMAAEELNNKKPPTKNAKESASVSQTPDALELKAITVVGEAENDPNY